MVQLADPSDVNEGLIIDRDRLHQALEAELKGYEARLRSQKAGVRLPHSKVDSAMPQSTLL